jgi:antitoxin VapB
LEATAVLTLEPETEELARRLAERRGTTPEVVVREAVEATARAAGLAKLAAGPLVKKASLDELMAIARHCATLPLLDTRSADEILGYDEHGLPS